MRINDPSLRDSASPRRTAEISQHDGSRPQTEPPPVSRSSPRPARDAILLPIGDKPSDLERKQREKQPTSEITPIEVPSLAELSRKIASYRSRVNRLGTEMLRRESEAKPFFTKVLTPNTNRQHKRLVSVVPILIIAVILLFIFAYIAAK